MVDGIVLVVVGEMFVTPIVDDGSVFAIIGLDEAIATFWSFFVSKIVTSGCVFCGTITSFFTG